MTVELEVAPEPYKPSALSFSSASTYNQCPRRWKHEKIDKREQLTPALPALVGSFVHEVLEFFYKLPPKERTIEAIRELATSQLVSFREESHNWALWDPNPEEITWFKQKCWPFITSIWDIEDPVQVDVVETEMDIQTEIGGVPFRGIIDRVEELNGELVVSDYKSGKPPLKRYTAPKLAQVILYSAVVEQELKRKPSAARLLFLGSEIISTTPTKASMNREVKALGATWDKIHWSLETEIFPTDPGPLCGWCPHVDICEDGQKEVKRRLSEGKLKKTAPAREVLGLGGYSPT